MKALPLDSRKIKVLAFDIDGTIFSSESIILETYQTSIQRYVDKTGIILQVPHRDVIMRQVGKPVKEIFLNLLPQLEESERDVISNQVLEILCEKIEAGDGEFYPEVKETMEILKSRGFTLVAASNGRRPYIETILRKADVLSFFEPILVLDYQIRKHKGEIVTGYLEQFQIQPEQLLMIGDRDSDYKAALFAGTPFLFCEYGHAETGEINDFSAKISCLPELSQILELL
jgi:phosphoglycolate phosphatase